MRESDFLEKFPGRFVKNFQGQSAFVADDLPPMIRWTDSLVRVVSRASQLLGELAGYGRRIPNPRRLVRMFLRREAEYSSLIENTFAPVETMLLFEQLPSVEAEAPDVREVHNNFLALEFGIKNVSNRKLGRTLIKEMHGILLRGVRGSDKTPGRFRAIQAHIGGSADIGKARFVPCPPHLIDGSMENLEKYLNHRGDIPAVARAAIAHYQFEAIHPFADGNGRVGRALLLVQLVSEGVLPAPLFNPSAQLELHRQEYYDRLLAVSQRGDWARWIEFFASSIADEAVEAGLRIEKLEALRAKYHDRVRKPRASALLPRLLDELFAHPSVSIPGAAKMLRITQASAFKLIRRLVDAGIVREVTGHSRNRVYLAQEIVDVFSTEPLKKR